MATAPQPVPESARALAAGLTFAVTVALFAFGGHWLDGRLSTSPLFVLLGVLLGLVGGTIHLLRVLAPGSLPFGKKPPDRGPPPPAPPASPR
jgi:F0F1-type ATP synthase assembly protein I